MTRTFSGSAWSGKSFRMSGLQSILDEKFRFALNIRSGAKAG